MIKKIDGIFHVVDEVFMWLSFTTLGGMTLLITIQVVCRYVLDAPLGWSEELARYGFIWMTFFAGYLGARQGQHISVELIQNLFPNVVKKSMKFLSALIISGFFGMVVYYLLMLWSKLATQKSAALHIPMNYVYLGMLIGCVFLFLAYMYEAVKIWLPEDKNDSSSKEASAD